MRIEILSPEVSLVKKTHDEVVRALPEVARISAESMRSAVIAIWLEVWSESSWDRLEEAPFNGMVPGVTLIDHVNQVTRGALDLAEQVDRHQGTSLDRDLILTASLLHDVSKMVEYEQVEGKHQKSMLGKSYQHAFYGAHKAQAHGLPMEVVAIIVNHTHESRTMPKTAEALCLYYADMCAADTARLAKGLPLLMHK
jgi:putative nucleotidyltransferase with HDIG domain